MVVETTGLADPAPILHTLMTDPLLASRYRLDGVVTTVDGVNGVSHARQSRGGGQAGRRRRPPAAHQESTSPTQPKLAELKHRLAQLNPGAPFQVIAAGEIDPNEILNAGLYNPETKTADVKKLAARPRPMKAATITGTVTAIIMGTIMATSTNMAMMTRPRRAGPARRQPPRRPHHAPSA